MNSQEIKQEMFLSAIGWVRYKSKALMGTEEKPLDDPLYDFFDSLLSNAADGEAYDAHFDDCREWSDIVLEWMNRSDVLPEDVVSAMAKFLANEQVEYKHKEPSGTVDQSVLKEIIAWITIEYYEDEVQTGGHPESQMEGSILKSWKLMKDILVCAIPYTPYYKEADLDEIFAELGEMHKACKDFEIKEELSEYLATLEDLLGEFDDEEDFSEFEDEE